MLWCSLALLALFASVQGRAVNISNTWVLPEEGFPVFYRYFRDRISWYEADAVCQFHHANLVTVDTTAQYDAVRAYLKELDISSAVWVGLIRSNPDGDFTWTDYRGLSGDGYWSSAPDARSAPLCAAADPAADYRWEARACGGPTVASFICELPVPQWALGNEGCMVRALPALTILYLPESAAVQLTADCGLAGVKRVQCTGNVKRENLLRDLSCEEEVTTPPSITSTGNTWPATITTDIVFTEQETTSDITTEENITTEHEDDINQSTIISTSISPKTNNIHKPSTKLTSLNEYNRIKFEKNLDLSNNNLQSNFISKIANEDNYLTNEQLEKLEDEKHMQHKMLHEEIARLGNVENIFTQPTDHFVPPLVMAKAKISDDMTVLSLQEKHAQQLAEQYLLKQNVHYDNVITTTEEPKTIVSENKSTLINESKDNFKKEKPNYMPKVYKEKSYEYKRKLLKSDLKPIKIEKHGEHKTTSTQFTVNQTKTTPMTHIDVINDGSSLDLTIVLKDSPDDLRKNKSFYDYAGDISKLEVIGNGTVNNETEIKLIDLEATDETKANDVPKKHFDEKIQNITMNHEVIKITIISDAHSSVTPTVFEVTTKFPSIQHTTVESTTDKEPVKQLEHDNKMNQTPTHIVPDTTQHYLLTGTSNIFSNSTDSNSSTSKKINTLSTTTTTKIPDINESLANANNSSQDKGEAETTSMSSTKLKQETKLNYTEEIHEKEYTTDNSTDTIDDFQSPLLSGANEPLVRPSRSRRPQQPPPTRKFNPFRILG